MKYFVVALILFLVSLDTRAQQGDTTTGEIRGRVIDSKTNKPLDYVMILVELNGIVKAQVLTDDEGNYEIRDLKSGEYTLKTSYPGYLNFVIQEIELSSVNNIAICNMSMEQRDGFGIRCPVIRRTIPLFDSEGKSGKTFISKDIQRLPY